MHTALRTHRTRLLALVCATLSWSAQAVEWGMSDSTLTDLSYDSTQSLLIRQVMGGAKSAKSRPVPARASTVASASHDVSVARKLAANYPPDKRSEAEKLFQRFLVSYHQIEIRFGIPDNDVAGAMAAFVAGSLMGYRNQDFPDAAFRGLVEQMRGAVAASPEFARANPTARREMYEKLAILGMAMATTQMGLKQQPDARVEANMRRAAKGYLEQFLGTDAERVAITPEGLVIR